MRYLGGKTRIAKAIAEQINRVRKPGQWVWEPFCGGLSVSVALSKAGPVWATDANPALIALYQAVQNGWQPPTELSKEEWQAAKKLPDSDPLKAFAGFGCSFGGMWFGSYAANQPIVRANGESAGYLTPAKSTAKLVCINAPQVRRFDWINFLVVEPGETQALIYCDPPYAGTASYKGVAPFDSAKFCLRVAEWSQFADVFVSEYRFPIGTCVWERTMKKNCARFANPTATERLYHIPKGSRF